MFWRKTSGMLRCEQSSMKCVAFFADSENKMPLFATMPIGYPWRFAKPVTIVVPYSFLNSSKREPSTMRAMTFRTSYGFLLLASNMLGGASQIVSMIRVKCNGK